MQSRRSRSRSISAAIVDLALLEVGASSTRSIRLTQGRPLIVKGREGWEVQVAAREGTIEVQTSGGAAVRVNDVQVRGAARALAGDLITLPDRSLLVLRVSVAPVAPAMLASHEAFEQRLFEEVERAAAASDPVAVLVVRSRALLGEGLAEFLSAAEYQGLRKHHPSMLAGHAAPATLELLCPGATGADADEIRGQLSEALGRLGRPFRWGWASAPSEAQDPASLWGRALDRLFAERAEPADELPRADPVMVRLCALCDVWAGMDGGVLLYGEVGSGRETIARVIHERRAVQAPLVVVRSATFDSALWRASVERARGGTLYVRHPDALPSSERTSFWDARAFRPMAGAVEPGPYLPPVVVSIPALRDRPLDILPIAEHILTRCTGLDTSRKPKLTASAKSVLSSEWTGSVRELKSLLQRAVLLVDSSGEVVGEHLASTLARFIRGPREIDLRASLRSVERSTLLETLARTNWNVTKAARALGLPRRTVVYRMSRLGLKRPASSG